MQIETGVKIMENRYAIILAAGKGTRMKSNLYKVLHSVAGKSMVENVLGQVEKAHLQKIITIVGYGAQAIKEELNERCEYVLQEEQLGTGHAVLQAETLLGDKEGITLVVTGDTPLLTTETINNLFDYHQEQKASATILTAYTEEPTGYGRIIRDAKGLVEKIVEQKDANDKEKLIKEVNTGMFCFNNSDLFSALSQITTDNSQGEFYLTDVIEILKNKGKVVTAFQMADFEEALGVNDRVALAEANKIMQRRLAKMHMMNGVTFIDPESTYIEGEVSIGPDTIIEAGVQLKGKTKIGKECIIGAHSEIIDSIIEDKVVVKHSVIQESKVHSESDVGPFAHLRPNATIGKHVHIGNFVEVKNSFIDEGTKVGHLTYVGDASLGKNINVGCGVVFVNYDGKNKYRTTVGDYAFIGSSTNIVAPVQIAEKSVIAAGSIITKDVNKYDLAIARAKQINKSDYAKKFPYLN